VNNLVITSKNCLHRITQILATDPINSIVPHLCGPMENARHPLAAAGFLKTCCLGSAPIRNRIKKGAARTKAVKQLFNCL
jgi:hypothetical protein